MATEERLKALQQLQSALPALISFEQERKEQEEKTQLERERRETEARKAEALTQALKEKEDQIEHLKREMEELKRGVARDDRGYCCV